MRTVSSVFAALLLLSAVPCCAAIQTDGNALVPGCNQFGVKLLQLIDKSSAGKNILISSYSISEAMNMTASGASGASTREIYDVIDGSKLSAEAISSAAKQLRDSLRESTDADPKVKITIANSLWVSQQVVLKKSFIDECKSMYDAMVRNVDFGTAAAVDAINNWVKQATIGKISKLVSRSNVDSSTVAVLVNAIYFKGLWSKPFKSQLTTDQEFHRTNNDTKMVKMMNDTRKFLYASSGDAEMIALPYGQGRMRMLVVLPAKNLTASAFLSSLNTDKLMNMRRSLNSRQVNLLLPKFKLEFGVYSLPPALKMMGIKGIFRGGEFQKMSSAGATFQVTDVLHKAIMEVDEEGTVAAAATAVLISRHAVQFEQPLEMRVDHPFLVFIEDTKSGMLLFSGLVRDPQF